MRLRTPKTLFASAIAIAAVTVVATALAAVTVYNNPLNTRSDMRELKQSGGGDRCDRAFAKKNKLMRVQVKGNGLCAYRPPVEGDANAADLQVRAVMKMIDGGSKATRKGAFLAVGVRAAGDRGYTLEIRPRGKRFKLTRGPDGGDFPISGRDNKVGGFRDKNVLVLRAFNNKVAAIVNGKRVASVTDPNSNQVDGRRVFVGVGSGRNTNNGPVATFEQVSVLVPDP
jgi:hypothetical protein